MVTDMTLSFQNGLVIYAIIHRYRRDLIDFASLDPKDIAAVNNQLAFNLLECELDISPVTTGQEMAGAEIIGQLLASAVTQRKKRRSAENEVREEEARPRTKTDTAVCPTRRGWQSSWRGRPCRRRRVRRQPIPRT